MTWQVGKEYKTRDGYRARIYATDTSNSYGYSIHGALLDEKGWGITQWKSDGESDWDSSFDLTCDEWREPVASNTYGIDCPENSHVFINDNTLCQCRMKARLKTEPEKPKRWLAWGVYCTVTPIPEAKKQIDKNYFKVEFHPKEFTDEFMIRMPWLDPPADWRPE